MRHLAPLLLAAGAGAQNLLLVPQQYPEIADAIAAASPLDIIEVSGIAARHRPIVVDRPLTIVGRPFEHAAPTVVADAGPAIDVRVPAGATVYLASIDATQSSAWAAPAALVRVRSGRLVLDDCRFSGGDSAGGGSAALLAEDADVALLRSRVVARFGGTGIRAVRSNLAGLHVRAFGAGPGPVGCGIELVASTLHGTEFEVLGGESVSTDGGVALHMDPASRCWLTDSSLRGGLGRRGGAGLVNLGTVPASLERCGVAGGLHIQGGGSAPPAVGPVDLQAVLLAAYQRPGLYRTFPAFRIGEVGGWALRAAPGTPMVVWWSERLGGAASLPLLAQPTWLPLPLPVAGGGFLAAAVAGSGEVAFSIPVPTETQLVGRGLWLHGVAGATLPLLAAPPIGGIVRR